MPRPLYLRAKAPGYPRNKSWISSRAGLTLRRESWEHSNTFLILLVSKDGGNNVRYKLTWSDWRARRFGTTSEWWEPRIAHKKSSCFSREHNYDSSAFPAGDRVTIMTRQVVFFCCRVRVECDLNYLITKGLSTSVSHFQIHFCNLTHFTKIFTVSSRSHI